MQIRTNASNNKRVVEKQTTRKERAGKEGRAERDGSDNLTLRDRGKASRALHATYATTSSRLLVYVLRMDDSSNNLDDDDTLIYISPRENLTLLTLSLSPSTIYLSISRHAMHSLDTRPCIIPVRPRVRLLRGNRRPMIRRLRRRRRPPRPREAPEEISRAPALTLPCASAVAQPT